MEVKRKKFQGVENIIRFNWHFYVLALAIMLIVFVTGIFLKGFVHDLFITVGIAALMSVFLSLVVSYYIYDYSDLYQFSWMSSCFSGNLRSILSINAGFDETSKIIADKFPEAILVKGDFYNPERHTEPSIERARRAYPPESDIILLDTRILEFQSGQFDLIFLIFAAHEIRISSERILFFKELKRILTDNGRIIIIEHLRDIPNFIAFNFGFFHFYGRSEWINTFDESALLIETENKLTPFIRKFILRKK